MGSRFPPAVLIVLRIMRLACRVRRPRTAACTVVLGALALASPGLALTTHRAPASQAQARITMASPVPMIYPLGSRLLFKFACTARSGLSSYRATLGGPGTRPHSVVPGSRFVPAKTGSYTLHITARDGHGKLTTTSSQFLLERATPGPAIVAPLTRARSPCDR